ncbi:hypothetical protein UNDYM_0123 [Undibacterium sp. YM2]|nr:hypothetical protein UNDYM_0123 [Undibacterium sp. YM2]
MILTQSRKYKRWDGKPGIAMLEFDMALFLVIDEHRRDTKSVIKFIPEKCGGLDVSRGEMEISTRT